VVTKIPRNEVITPFDSTIKREINVCVLRTRNDVNFFYSGYIRLGFSI
jgi:hypothetical protein